MLFILAGIALIALWAYATVASEAPGWIHLFLTVGLALVIYGIVKPSRTGLKR